MSARADRARRARRHRNQERKAKQTQCPKCVCVWMPLRLTDGQPRPGAALGTDCERAGSAGAENGVKEETTSQGPATPTPEQGLTDSHGSNFKKGQFHSQGSWAASQEGHVAPPKISFRLSCHLSQVRLETFPVVLHKSRAAYFRKPRIGPSQGQ